MSELSGACATAKNQHLKGHMLQIKPHTVAAVSLLPRRTYVTKVKMDMTTGVVAQKYTHNASRYFRPRRYFSSDSRSTAKDSRSIEIFKAPSHCQLLGNDSNKTKLHSLSKKGKAVPLQAWSGPEGSRKLRFPDFMTMARDGGKVVSLKHRPPLPPENTPGTHFC